ncbi:exported hypothetical protein [Burkholderiales bacterium]|nr:exported hypothetical protein [Burkholderiales bacterium]
MRFLPRRWPRRLARATAGPEAATPCRQPRTDRAGASPYKIHDRRQGMRNVPGVGGKTALALLALGTFALPASAAPSAAMEG